MAGSPLSQPIQIPADPRQFFALQFVVIGFLCICAFVAVLALAKGAIPDSGLQAQGLAQELAAIDPALVDESAWQPVAASDPLCRRACSQPHKAFLFRFDQPVERTPLSLYVPLYGAAEFWLNDVLIGRTGRLQAPLSDGGYRPYQLELPEQLVSARSNELLILVAGFDVGGHSLGPVFIGPRAAMSRAHGYAWLLLVDAMVVSVGIMGFLMLLSAMLYLQTGRSSVYLCFMALLMFACLRAGLRLSPDWPAGHSVRMPLYFVGTIGVLLASTLLVRRLAERRFDRFEAFATSAAVMSVAVLAIALAADRLSAWLAGVAFTQVLAIAVSAYQIWLLAGVLPVTLKRFAPSVICLFVLAIALVLHEVVSHRLFGPLVIPTSHLAVLPLILALAVVIAERYQSVHTGLALERQKLAAERARLRSDIHDGVGGELAGLLMQARRGLVDPESYADALANSLRDLRVMIDSLDPRLGTDLASALGALRSRLQPWVEGCGFQLRWQNELPSGIDLGEEKLLTLYRLLQELVANAVRHSGGDEIRAEFSASPSHVLLRFSDNGSGLLATARAGAGLANIEARAQRLGAQLTRQSSPRGLVWDLAIPYAFSSIP